MAGKPKKKSNAGRPKFKATKKQLNAVYELARHGATELQMAEALGMTYSTFRYHKGQFLAEIKKGREEGEDINITLVENALLKAAKGFEYEETHIERKVKDGKTVYENVKKVKKYYPPNTGAIFFYLVNRGNGRWKSINNMEINLPEDATKYFAEIADALNQLDSNTKKSA